MEDTSKNEIPENTEKEESISEQVEEITEQTEKTPAMDYVWSERMSVNTNLVTLMVVSDAMACLIGAMMQSWNADSWLELGDIGIGCGVLGFACWGHIWWRLVSPNLVSARKMWRYTLAAWALLVFLEMLVWGDVLTFSKEEMMSLLILNAWLAGAYLVMEFGLMYALYMKYARRGQGFFDFCNLEQKFKL